MNTPKFEIQRHVNNGKVQIELIVWCSTFSDELHNIVVDLGYKLTTDVSGRRSIMCSTPEEVDAARKPILKFFDAKGDWK